MTVEELKRDWEQMLRDDMQYICDYWRKFLGLPDDVPNQVIIDMLREYGREMCSDESTS